MSHQPVDLIEVHAWDHLVGAVAADPNGRGHVFEYADEWRDLGIELSPLHLPTTTAVHHFPDLNPATYLGLPPLLADSLPDRFGNALVNAWMARHGVAADDITALDRLAYAADRGMGALTFRPAARDGSAVDDVTAIQLADLVTAARRALQGNLDDDDAVAEESLNELLTVGTSAGGARAKAVVAYNPDTGQVRSGQLDAPPGFEHWICKLDGVADSDLLGHGRGFGRVEYAYHLMALQAGLDMMRSRLVPEHDRAHFFTRRFDRTDEGDRLHLLTLCGLAHLDFNQARAHDYAQYLDTIDALGLGPEAREQAFHRIVFNVAAVNCDDHTKNVAFLMDREGTWSLAPAYDVTYAYNPAGRWTSAHQMGVGGKFSDISLADLEELADRFAVPSPGDAIERVLAAVDAWPEHATAAGVPEPTVDAISAAHDRFRPT